MICTIDAPELIKMVADPDNPGIVYRPIFEENVRVYLSGRNNINREIISTALSDDRHLFWYLNNGITITCSSFSYVKGSRAPIVSLNDVQIVNGGQTSNALFEAYLEDPDKVSDVLILARIIEAKEESVGHKVSETTNSQTPIKSRDLRANSLVQRKIEAALAAKGFSYERKSNQHADQPRDKRIDAQTAGQAYLAYALDMPEVAKKDRGRVFGDLFETVFSDDLIPENLLTPLTVFKKIEIFKKDTQRKIRLNEPIDQEDMFIIDGAYHVLFAVRRICDRDAVDHFSDSAVSKVQEAISIVKTCVRNNMSETFSFNRFFKEAGTRTRIEALISKEV